ncbi:MAG: SPOR domain-containing protein [Sulfitobacter sp.]
MKLTRILVILALAGSIGTTISLGGNGAQAQITEVQPAEFPPASYKGKQYVDSQGCVFIRAGIDGNVSWVPRVSRDRKAVCGFRPSTTAQATAAPAAAPVEAPVQITLDAPAPVTAAPRAAPARAAAPAPQPRRAAPVVVRQTAPKPTPRVVAKAPVVVTPAPTPQPVRRTTRVVQGASACPGASALSQRYLRGSGVRCGPQTEPIISSGVATTSVTTGQAAPVARSVTANTRIVPKHVAQNRVNTRNVAVPKGYKPVWTDDRLNPNRAEQSLSGRSQMLLVWTQTLPRRLIDRRTGKDVTASVPLVYPYINEAQQRSELGEVTIVRRDGQRLKRIVRNPGAKSVARQPVLSSRSTPKAADPKQAKPSKALAGKSFVQVGTFGNPANAQRAARNIAKMGLPARIGKYRKAGKSYLNVQAGPFSDAGALHTAMKRLQRAGYKDAFAR